MTVGLAAPGRRCPAGPVTARDFAGPGQSKKRIVDPAQRSPGVVERA